MGARGEKSVPALGFLAVCDLQGRGLVGGYLLLNTAGRPLEFHCTAPVKPSRAQEILYGPTLEPFLYGEQIGRALVEKPAATPLAVFTDHPAVLAAQAFVAAPLAVVVTADHHALAAARFHRFEFNGCSLAMPVDKETDAATLLERLSANGVSLDLAEPFERIREAVREAHRDASTRQTGPTAEAA